MGISIKYIGVFNFIGTMLVGMVYFAQSFPVSTFTAVLLTLPTSTHTLSSMVKFSNVVIKPLGPCSLLVTRQVCVYH